MSNDENEIIDAEIVEDDYLPAVVKDAWSGERMDRDSVTRGNGVTYEAKAGRTADGLSLDAAAVAKHDAALAANPERRCVAMTPKGQCRKFAILGSTVCKTHGGATKHVVNKARVRIEMAGNRLMGKLIEFAFDDTKPPDTQLRAIRDSLDRAGLRPPAEVVLSQGEIKPYEELFDDIASGSRAESRRARGLPDTDDDNAGWPADERSQCQPPAQPDSPYPSDTDEHCARRESLTNPTTYTGDGASRADQLSSNSTPYGETQWEHIAGQDNSPSEASGAVHRPRPRESGRHTHAQRPPHITGEAAMRGANEANRAIGAMPDQLAIESRHKRYRRP